MKDDIPLIIIILIVLTLIIGGIILYFVSRTPLEKQLEQQNKPLNQGVPMVQGNSLIAIAPPYYFRTYVLGMRIITAYSSSLDETDSTPFITASGQRVKDGIVATNELPFGTLIKIDNEIYEVQDRMHSKYPDRIDIWMSTKEKAKQFGKQVKEVLLIK